MDLELQALLARIEAELVKPDQEPLRVVVARLERAVLLLGQEIAQLRPLIDARSRQ